MKICTKCSKDKEDYEFNKCSKARDGLAYNCKQCKREYNELNKEYFNKKSLEKYYANHEENKLKQRQIRERHKIKNNEKRRDKRKSLSIKQKEEIKKTRAIYYKENPDIFQGIKERSNRKRIKKQIKEKEFLENTIITVKYPEDKYKVCSKCFALKENTHFRNEKRKNKIIIRPNCRDCDKIINNILYYKNRDKILERAKKASKTEEFKSKQREIHKLKYKTDIQYHLKKKFSAALKRVFKEFGVKKDKSSFLYLDCSPEFYKVHIESQFTDQMCWERLLNSEIDIDHWIPCEAFELSNEKEAKICFHWTNLRPEWSEINGSKNDKMPDGTRARETKSNYSLEDKKNMIKSRLISLNLPHITSELIDF